MMHLYSRNYARKKIPDIVLILVVMDDALVRSCISVSLRWYTVLILVVMDDALVQLT